MQGIESAKQLADLVMGIIMALIGMGGLAFGGWNLFDGFTNEQPEGKKKGIITLLVAVFAIILILSGKSIVYSLAGI